MVYSSGYTIYLKLCQRFIFKLNLLSIYGFSLALGIEEEIPRFFSVDWNEKPARTPKSTLFILP
jgi:hypothetical protein